MKQLLDYLLWKLRRRRLVRLHHEKMEQSLEGFLVGVWGGHYILRAAKILEAEGRTLTLDGPEVRVPREHILFVEVLA